MIKVIIFDLGNVLIPFDYRRAVQKYVDLSGVPSDAVVHFFTRSEYDKLYVEGKISTKEFFNAVKEHLKMNVSFDEFKYYYNAIFEHNAEMESLIEQLGVHYPLAILSNTNELHFDFIIENYPIMKEFDEYIVSYKEHCQKPHYEIFQKALAKLDVAPQHVVFIDDLEVNVVAATQIGIRGIQFTTIEALIEKMKKYGVCI